MHCWPAQSLIDHHTRIVIPIARISQHLIDRYSAGPSPTKTSQVSSLQTTIRDELGRDFDTFLQGSYKNNTALPDINDVDIVARRKAVRSPQSAYFWESVFADIAMRLRASRRISGAVSIGDKCVKLRGSNYGLDADVVPAVAKDDFATDPVMIWSRREKFERPNFPRTHYANGVRKQARTSNSYKATVRLFKRWRTQYAEMGETAPSYYVECAVHHAQAGKFSAYLPASFLRVGLEILGWRPRSTVIWSVAHDKDILVPSEWHPDKFQAFQAKLRPDVLLVGAAMLAKTTAEADRLWKQAFGEV